MFFVNSYITFIPLLVSTIWSIYEVFHLILFWGQTACLEEMDRQQLSKMDPGLQPYKEHPAGGTAQGWKEAPPARTRGTRMGPGARVEQMTSLLPLRPAGMCFSRDERDAQRQLAGQQDGRRGSAQAVRTGPAVSLPQGSGNGRLLGAVPRSPRKGTGEQKPSPERER